MGLMCQVWALAMLGSFTSQVAFLHRAFVHRQALMKSRNAPLAAGNLLPTLPSPAGMSPRAALGLGASG